MKDSGDLARPEVPVMPETAGSLPQQQIEREIKLDVGDDFVLPGLVGTDGVALVDEPVTHELAATYFDTLDLRLLSRSVTLRRRTGGTDAGWHLKLPEAPGVRTELSAPIGPGEAADPPEQLLQLVRGLVRRRALRPVLLLQTRRQVRVLRDAHGRPLAEVADDEVSAHPLQTGSQRCWREVEVELLDEASPDLLEGVAARLLAAGATRAAPGSKASRALGDALPVPPGGPSGARAEDGPRAGDVVRGHLADLLEELMRLDPRVRLDAPDAVHRMRVATRRLRSVLASFADLLTPEVVPRLRAELAWLATMLGAARDAEVLRERLVALVQAEPPELVRGPVRERIEALLGERYRLAHAEVVSTLDGPRYLDLLDALAWLCRQPVEGPPWTPRAVRPAPGELARAMRSTWRRVRRLAEAAERAGQDERAGGDEAGGGDTAQVEAALHEVRKAAKRARYAAESLVEVFGAPSRRFAARMTRIQDTLGANQDSVVTRAVLAELAELAERAGESTFTYGRLHALEQRRGAHTAAAFTRQLARASRASATDWMR